MRNNRNSAACLSTLVKHCTIGEFHFKDRYSSKKFVYRYSVDLIKRYYKNKAKLMKRIN